MQSDIPSTGHPAASLRVAPLFHAAWLFAAGILLVRWLWLRPSLVLIAVALTALLSCVAAVRALRVAWLPLSAMWLLLGAWCALMQPQPAPAPALAALSDDLLRQVDGTVIDSGSPRVEGEENVDERSASAPTQRIDLELSSIERVTDSEDDQLPVTGDVRLTVRWPIPNIPMQAFHCGERIRAVVRLLPPASYHDPGVWSRSDYLLDQRITSTASVSIDRVNRLGGSPRASLSCRLATLQHATTARLLALPAAMRSLPAPLRLTEDDAIMLAAMVAGDRTYLTHTLRVGFERTGSFHMLVVSGFHLAIVAACIFWIARRLRLPRIPATLLTISVSFLYALFTGFATPVQRSLWMISLYLVGRLFFRERRPLNTIGFAALCLLTATPRSLLDSSLQMTLLAVISIAGVAMPLLQATIHPYWTAVRDLRLVAIDIKLDPRLAQFRVTLRMMATRLQAATNPFVAWRALPWTVRSLIRVLELVVVSCGVELAMALPMALYFHRITLAAFPVNMLILPLLAVLMPAALVTLLALAIWPHFAFIPATAAAFVLHLGVGLVHLFGSLAFADFRIPTPLLWQCVAFCAFLAAAIAFAQFGCARSLRWPLLAAWTAMLLAGLAAVVPHPIDHPRNALLVEIIDVGQGDSILLVTPDGKTLLVDGGGFGGGPRQAPQDFDIGEEVVSPALWARGIRHLDAVALTHAHSDHMGGLPAVLRNFHPGELWVGNNPRFGAYNALLAEAATLQVQVRSFRAGDAFSFGRTHVNVFAPFRDYQPGLEPTNNDSLVMRVNFDSSSVLMEGDAEAPVEQAMLLEPGLASTLLKVGHHGSVTSTRPGFLARVSPRWAVISCGLHNRYGHPRAEVLQELASSHVRTLSTDINGASCFILDGKSAAADPGCYGRLWPMDFQSSPQR